MAEAGSDGSVDEPTRVLPDAMTPTARLAPSLELVADRPLAERLKDAAERSYGARLGRYNLLRLLGEGGMGVVFAAYDEELDRKVAIKLLRTPRDDAEWDPSWLLSEARAMARLSHPNIVQVYDVGEVEGQPFLAMEFIVGASLRDWFRAERRDWREVLGACVQAGRGLEAAHEAGLVHCDFKPPNVLVGKDGRVRVLDFGLARLHERVATDAGAGQEASQRTTHLAGTPGYIAPELYVQGEPDARSDQFAFCVALYEGLYGERPFRGKTPGEVKRAVCLGEPTPPSDARVPAWLRRAVLRGLARDARARWPSMHALLAHLEREGRRGPTRLAALGLGAAALAGGLWLGLSPSPETCPDDQESAGRVWPASDRAAVKDALEASGLPFAADSARAALDALDGYATAWGAVAAQTCEEHRRGRLSERVHLLQQRCLDQQATALRAIVDVLRAADAGVVENAMKVVGGLPDADACRDHAALLAASDLEIPPPLELAATIDAARARLAGIAALHHAARYDQARAELDALDADPRLRTHAPLAAELSLASALNHRARGDFPAAERPFWTAVADAERGRAQPIKILAALELARFYISNVIRLDDGERWLDLAAAFVAASDRPGRHAGDLALLRGDLAIGRSDNDAAIRHYEEARTLLAQRLGDDRIEVAEAIGALGRARRRRGQLAEAAVLFDEARRRLVALLGAQHPAVALQINALGLIHLEQGELRASLAEFRRALEIRSAVLPAEHPDIAVVLNNIGLALDRLGEHAEAAVTHERALAIREAALGPDHPRVANSLHNLAICRVSLGQLDVAEALGRRLQEFYARNPLPGRPDSGDAFSVLGSVAAARDQPAAAVDAFSQEIAIIEKALGRDHLLLAGPLLNRAFSLTDLGRLDDAEADLLRSQALLAELPPDSPELAHPYAGLAELAIRRGDGRKALELLARAATQAARETRSPEYSGDLAWAQARALRMLGEQPERALELANEAERLFRTCADTPENRRTLQEIEAWRSQPGPAGPAPPPP